MENKLAKIERKKKQLDFKLLPSYWKGVGVLLMLIAGAAALLLRYKGVGITPDRLILLQNFALHAIILGLLLVAASRDKHEDELTQALRVKSMAIVFVTSGVLVVIQPFFTLLGEESPVSITAANLMVESLIFYILLYNFQKLMR